MAPLRITVVGAGVAGLATAAGLHRAGHQVEVHEQAEQLRSGGLGLNLWSNATTILPHLGVPPDALPGEPFDRMVIRTGGRARAQVPLPAAGLPHVNVERSDLMAALAAVLPAGAVHLGSPVTSVEQLRGHGDLVVLADGVHATVTDVVLPPPRRHRTWAVWQAVIDHQPSELAPGTGAVVTRGGFFCGIWRMPRGRTTWFVEAPALSADEDPAAMLARLSGDRDPMVAELAAATPADRWIRWEAEERLPAGRLVAARLAVVGDAAHAMLPCLGQGACAAIEDAAALVDALGAERSLPAALERYDRVRRPRVRRSVRLARLGCHGRAGRAVDLLPPGLFARSLAVTSGPVLRRITRPPVATRLRA